MSIIEYLSTIFGEFPQLSVIKYIVASVVLLIIIEAIVSLLSNSIQTLFKGS